MVNYSDYIKKYTAYILCASLVISIYLMNSYVPFFSDDMHCAYYGSKLADNLKDVIQILCYDYNTCNGRIIPNLMVLLAVRAGENFFNFINTLITAAAFIMLWKTASVRKGKNVLLTFLVLSIGFLSLSTGIDSLYYWAAGASNYVWTLIPTLFFVHIMENNKLDKKNIFFVLSLGYILALQHEMYICPIAASYWTVFILKKEKFNKSQIFLLTGFTLGTLTVVAAPGNFGRGAVYTIGLGTISRIIKIMYSLRVFYIMLLAIVICYIKNRDRTKLFLRQNAVLVLIIAYSGIIPFLSATASRAVYATDIFSLIVLVRLIEEFSNGHSAINTSLCACLAAFLIWFQGYIVIESKSKWNIYKQAVDSYYHQPSNTVIMDDIQCSNPLIEYYTVNMNNILTPYDKSTQLALQKYRLQGRTVSEDNVSEQDLIKIIPANIDTSNNGKTVPYLMFTNHPQMRYYIMRYKTGIVDKINNGYMYALYEMPITGWKIKINYLKNDVIFERAAYEIEYKGKKYILLNKKYKHYPFIHLLHMGFNTGEPSKKIEISF